MNNKGTLILSGMGLNCERETAYACEKSGASNVDIVHTLDFLSGKVSLSKYDFLVFIGGFLDGDYLGAARVGVNRIKYGAALGIDLKAALQDFVAENNLVMGICNGFQLLVKLGLLPDEEKAFLGQSVSLTQNQNSRFEDRWVHLKVNPNSPSVFTKGLDQLYLPVRHGEGRLIVGGEDEGKHIRDNQLDTLYYADANGNPTENYPENPNGSWMNVAGLSNKKGTVFGLMPHPEAYNHYTNHPHWTRKQFSEEDGEGLLLFKNAYAFLGQ